MTQGTLKASEPLKQEPPIAEKGDRKGVKIFFLAGGALFIAIAVLGISSRTAKTSGLQQQSNEAAQVIVNVVHPEKAATIIPLQLPGQTRAYIEAPIFAQTSGYLKKWYFDIGAKVKAGDVLAEIDTPQVDQQFKQAQAQLKVAESARDLAGSTFRRDQDLYNRKVIAAQDFDTASDTYRQSRGDSQRGSSLRELTPSARELQSGQSSLRWNRDRAGYGHRSVRSFGFRGAALQNGANLAAPSLRQCAANILAFCEARREGGSFSK